MKSSVLVLCHQKGNITPTIFIQNTVCFQYVIYEFFSPNKYTMTTTFKRLIKTPKTGV
jgi:hypothetical protein